MVSKIKEIEHEALNLSVQDRALLAEHLINSLDIEEDPEAEKLWIVESERRYGEYKAGKAKSKSAKQVFKDAYSKLK